MWYQCLPLPHTETSICRLQITSLHCCEPPLSIIIGINCNSGTAEALSCRGCSKFDDGCSGIMVISYAASANKASLVALLVKQQALVVVFMLITWPVLNWCRRLGELSVQKGP